MTELFSKIMGGIGVLLALAIIIGGPAACIVLEKREITSRVEAACGGSMSDDPLRAVVCAQALVGAGK